MDAIEIAVGRQHDGFTFRLRPQSRARLLTRAAALPASLFVGYDTRADFEGLHGPLWDHIAQVLTGLSAGELETTGVVFVDPVSGRRVHGASADV